MVKRLFAVLLMTFVSLIIIECTLVTNLETNTNETIEHFPTFESYIAHQEIKQKTQQKIQQEIQQEVEEKQIKIVRAKVTAYAPHDNKSGMCNDGNPNTTATGVYPRKGIVAVDPRKIAYGTKMYIPGYGHAEAQDTGGALRSYNGIHIDVVMDSYEEAIRWGVKYLDVELEI